MVAFRENVKNPILKPDNWDRCCSVLAYIIMQKIKNICYSVSEKMSKKLDFLTLNPMLIPGLFFFKPDT